MAHEAARDEVESVSRAAKNGRGQIHPKV
jgi:hypothetical protein